MKDENLLGQMLLLKKEREGFSQEDPMAQEEPKEEIDLELEAALDERDKQRRYADLLGGFKSLGESAVYGSGYKADMSMIDKLNKRAEEPVQEYKDKAKAEKAQEALDLREQKYDDKIKLEQTRYDDKTLLDKDRYDSEAILKKEKHKADMNAFKISGEQKKQIIAEGKLRAKVLGQKIMAEDKMNDSLEQTSGPVVASIRKETQVMLNELASKGNYEPEILPDDLTLYQYINLNKHLKSGKASSLDDFKQKNLALKEKNYLLRLKKENRLLEKDTDKRVQKDELSDKQTDHLISLDDGMNLATRMLALLPKVKDNLGFYASTLAEAKKIIPYKERDPDFVEMGQIAGTGLADYIKSISGAAVSEQEAMRLRANIPNMDDKPVAFKRKVDTFMRLLKEYKSTKITNYRKQGKNPDRFDDSIAKKKEVLSLSKQDKAALKWAKENSDDPRASAILDKLERKGQ